MIRLKSLNVSIIYKLSYSIFSHNLLIKNGILKNINLIILFSNENILS